MIISFDDFKRKLGLTPKEDTQEKALSPASFKPEAAPEYSYDMESDPTYSSLKKTYLREADRASQQTVGNYAQMTGGLPSTAALSAASQAGDYYREKLADRIPALEENAYGRYQNELMAQGRANEAAYNRLLDQIKWEQGERAYADSKSAADYDRAWNEKKYADTRGDVDYDRAWNEKKYADTRGDVDYDREFGERKYADSRADASYDKLIERIKMMQQDKAYADSRADAAYDREWNEKKYADTRDDVDYNRAQSEMKYADTRADVEYDRAIAERQWTQKLREYADARADAAFTRALTLARSGDFREFEALGYDPSYLAAGMKNEAFANDFANACKQADYGDFSGLAKLGVDTSNLQKRQQDEAQNAAIDRALLLAKNGDFKELKALGYDTKALESQFKTNGKISEYELLTAMEKYKKLNQKDPTYMDSGVALSLLSQGYESPELTSALYHYFGATPEEVARAFGLTVKKPPTTAEKPKVSTNVGVGLREGIL